MEDTTVPCAGAMLHRCVIDHNTLVELHDLDNNLAIQIETEFVLTDKNGKHTINPATGDNVALLLCVLGCRIVNLFVSNSDTLYMKLDSGSELHVYCHPDYESWHLFMESPKLSMMGGPPAVNN